MVRRRINGIMLGALMLALATSASALSITAQREHDPNRACADVERLLKVIWAGNKDDGLYTWFFTDGLGSVEWEERQAFITSMTSSEGKRDDRPLKIERLYRLTKDKFDPLYLVSIARSVWHEYRDEMDGDGNSERIPDPRHYSESTYWLIEFSSNDVARFREAFELYQLADEDRRVKGCGG